MELSAVRVHFLNLAVVDTSRSENPDAATGGGRGGMGGGHGHGGGMGGGGMAGGGMGGMDGGRHGGGGDGPGTRGENAGGNGDMMRRALLLPNTLDIALQPTSLTLTPDGHPRSVPMVTGEDSADVTRAGWDGDSLVVVVHIDDKGGDIVQHYDLAPDRSRIVVTTEFRGNGKKRSIVREFTAATPDSVAAPEG